VIYKNPILLTGAPRSGTSWAGRMIGQEPFVRYVHEPFNISGNFCLCGVNFKYWFQYISRENYHYFEDHLRHTIYPAYTLIGLLNTVMEMARTKRIRTLSRYFQAYLSHRLVVKDPLAVFSAETLAHLFAMDVVVLIRHPAAVVSSYKTLNWTHSFSHFLEQPELMDEHLAPFRNEIDEFAKAEHDIIDQAALLWKLIHFRIIKYQETQPNWIFVRYEDLALDPIEEYRKIFGQLGLSFSDHTRAVILAHNLQDRSARTTDPYAVKQDSHQVISKWRKNLTLDEIARIRSRVEDISSAFFSNDEW
jgi:hypothetical protein